MRPTAVLSSTRVILATCSLAVWRQLLQSATAFRGLQLMPHVEVECGTYCSRLLITAWCSTRLSENSDTFSQQFFACGCSKAKNKEGMISDWFLVLIKTGIVLKVKGNYTRETSDSLHETAWLFPIYQSPRLCYLPVDDVNKNVVYSLLGSILCRNYLEANRKWKLTTNFAKMQLTFPLPTSRSCIRFCTLCIRTNTGDIAPSSAITRAFI